MTDPNDFYHKPCEKLSGACVDAFAALEYDPTNDHNLVLNTSWGESTLDMQPIVKANETVTHLSLTETALQYDNEGTEPDCITGDNLSSIISMHLLKDVNKTVPLEENMVYVWDGTQFTPQNIGITAADLVALQQRVSQLETSVSLLQTSNTSLTQKVTTLENQMASLTNRVTQLEAVTAKPSWAPSNAVLAWGNINNEYNADPTGKGIYTHNPSTNVTGDERFD